MAFTEVKNFVVNFKKTQQTNPGNIWERQFK